MTASLGAMVHYKLPLDLSACPSAATLAHARARSRSAFARSELVCSARTTHALATIAMVTPYSPEEKLNPDLCCHEFLFYKYIQVRSPNLVLKHKRKVMFCSILLCDITLLYFIGSAQFVINRIEISVYPKFAVIFNSIVIIVLVIIYKVL